MYFPEASKEHRAKNCPHLSLLLSVVQTQTFGEYNELIVPLILHEVSSPYCLYYFVRLRSSCETPTPSSRRQIYRDVRHGQLALTVSDWGKSYLLLYSFLNFLCESMWYEASLCRFWCIRVVIRPAKLPESNFPILDLVLIAFRTHFKCNLNFVYIRGVILGAWYRVRY